jgi:CHAT domain-containing protein
VAAGRVGELARTVVAILDASASAAYGGADPARAVLRELHAYLIAPVARLLPEAPARRVVFVPHGVIAQVPFAALEDATGAPLVGRHTISTAPSVSVFRYTGGRARRDSRPPSSLVFAAPAAPPDTDLPVLPGSLDEGRRVADRLVSFAPVLLEGGGASEHVAKARLPGAAYVHFATHGLVSDVRPADSSLVLAAGGGEDGFLRAAEIYGLELTADLVVLSGCSTARGRPTGDGVFGLPRAFLFAGAPSVVASLWDISDRATVFLMDRFYAELLRTRDKAAALRAAQLATRERYAHPALWAPFVLVGEPR